MRTYVHNLHREDKQLVVVTEDEEAIISYEYLVFATGTQYCIEEGQEGQSPPANVYTLNDSEDEENAAGYFETLSTDRGTYGCAYLWVLWLCCLACTYVAWLVRRLEGKFLSICTCEQTFQ